MRVAVYCRVSTDDQDASVQESELLAFCVARGFSVFRVYTDVVSGSKDSRPSLNVLMIDAYNRRFDCVLVWKLDRLGRSVQHLVSIVNNFKLWGVGLIVKTQDIDTTTANGMLLFHIFSAVAEFERDLIRERTRLGLKRAFNVGKRGKDKKPRKRGGYFLRHSPHLKGLVK